MSRADVSIAVVASLAAATAYAFASALQHEQTQAVDRRASTDPRLLLALSGRPIWLLGLLIDVAAVALQVVALRFGPVLLVQPLLVAGLPLAVLLSSARLRRRTARAELVGVLLCAAGLTLVVPATKGVALNAPAGARAWTIAGLVVCAASGALLVLARYWSRSAPVATGLTAGIATGAASVLLAVCAGQLGDLPRLLTTPAPYAAAVTAFAGLLLTQACFQTGAIAAPLAALSIAEPAVAIVLALTVLRERLPASLGAQLAGAAGIGLAIAGLAVLARTAARAGSSPVTAAVRK